MRLWRGSIAVVVFPSLMGCVFLYKLLTLSVPQILGSPAFLPAGGLKATREGWGRGTVPSMGLLQGVRGLQHADSLGEGLPKPCLCWETKS